MDFAAAHRLRLESSAAIARAIGASHFQIMARELLPNLVPPISAIVVLSMSRIIVIEGTLSFLGLSLPPPAPTWGNMIAAGVSELASTRPSGLSAGVMFITILALVVISDALRRASDLRGDQSRHFAGLPMTSGLHPEDEVIGRPSLWIAEDFGCCASG
jgi:peptide/nickel transport system permease protein